MTLQTTQFFLRPNNLTISTILQNLRILSYIARNTDGDLISFNCPREPETQRLLNFGSVTVREDGARILNRQQQRHRIPLDKRSAMDSATLLVDLPIEQRGASLQEVADLVGIRLGDAFKKSKIDGKDGRRNDFDIGSTFDSDNPKRGEERYIDLKIERSRSSPKSRPSKFNLGTVKEKRLIREMMNFGGFTNSLDEVVDESRKY